MADITSSIFLLLQNRDERIHSYKYCYFFANRKLSMLYNLQIKEKSNAWSEINILSMRVTNAAVLASNKTLYLYDLNQAKT